MLVIHVTSPTDLKDSSLNFWLAEYIVTSHRYKDDINYIVNHIKKYQLLPNSFSI